MKKSNKILILSQYFYPDIASTGQLLTELATGLSLKGVKVSVLTALPSYGKNINAAKRENLGEVEVRRLWTTKIDKNTKKGQILNSVSFFISAFLYLLFSGSKAPILIVSNPPFLPFLGPLIHTLKRRKYIYLIHDVFPDKAIRLKYLKESSFMYKIWRWMDKYILRTAADIVVLSDSMKKVILEKYRLHNIKPHKITVIHNWADGVFIKPLQSPENPFIKENKLDNKFIIQYSGNLGASYELEFIIEAAKKINDKDILFMFIGDGVKKQKLMSLVEQYKLTNVQFYPYQKKDRLPYSLTAASVSLVTYDKKLDGLLMPSKLYTIMATGTSIIGICDPSTEVANIIKDAQCGVTVCEDPDELIKTITYLKDNQLLREEYGKNARKYFEINFTIHTAVNKYYDVIDNIKI